MIYLTKHFTLEEVAKSPTATRHGIDNTPPDFVVENARMLAFHVLEPLRLLIGDAVRVQSWYRSNELNLLVNGKENSQHKIGMAADIVIDNFTPAEVCQIIADHFPFDQLINEFDEWTHVSYDTKRLRRDKRVIEKVGNKILDRTVEEFL